MAKITVKDHNGEILSSFDSVVGESIASQSQEAGAPVPVSCGVGACRACVCKVEQGAEWIDYGDAMIDLEDDECLTCIATVKADTPAEAVIVLVAENL